MKAKEKYIKQINERYVSTRKRSKELFDEACRYMPGGDTRTSTFFEPYPHRIVEAQGAYMYDADGNKLIDFQNNFTSLIHGHAHPPTVEAVSNQMKKGTAYASPFPGQSELAKLLVERIPGVDMLRFTNSGTDSTMNVLQAACAYTNRAKIVKVEGGYHGTTDVFEASKDVLVAPFNYIEETKAVIEKNHQDIACFIVEPVLGSAGQILPQGGYLEFTREITKHYGILLVFDEIVTLRLAMGGAQELFNIDPDLTAFGKIIGGGIPIGAFGGKEEIMKIYDPRAKKMYHSGTFNGNAAAMAAGLAAMSDFTYDKLVHINTLGTQFKASLEEAFKEIGVHVKVNGTGSLFNLIFSDKDAIDYRGVAGSHEGLNRLLFLDLLTRGVFNAPRGMFCMSTAMTGEDIDFAAGAIKGALFDMKETIKEIAPELVF